MKKKDLVGLNIYILLFVSLIFYPSYGQSKTKKALPKPVQIENQAIESLKRGKVLLNFESADITLVAKFISELTGKNIIVDDRVKGKITILSSQEVTPSEAWSMFVASIQPYGYDMVDKGTYAKIVPAKSALQEKTRFYSESAVAEGGDDFLVAVIGLKNAAPDQLATIIKSFTSDVGIVMPYKPSNSILIGDTSFNVKRLIQIAKTLDVKGNKKFVKIYYLKFLDSSQFLQTLKQVYVTKDKDIEMSEYKPSNAVVVQATLNQIQELDEIINRMDKKVDNPDTTRKFRVIYLENANAKDVAEIISGMLKEGQEIKKKTQTVSLTTVSSPEGSRSRDRISRDDTAVAEETMNTSSQEGVAVEKESAFTSTRVSADEETNSLIMYLSNSEMEEIEPLIKSLDAPRRQVLVSAVIAEVSLKRLMESGANWQLLNKDGTLGAAFGGGKSMEAIYQLLASGNFVMGGVGKTTTTINVDGKNVEYPNVFGILSFLNTDSDFNLLSAPRLLTLDHKESKINVGAVIPFATGVKFDSNGQPVVTYDYKNVGLTLTVTPHISQGRFVRLKINQKIEDVTDYIKQDLGALGYVVPVVSAREVDTAITVGDSQTIIIGGLVSKKTIDSIKKVPILGDIPIIGSAFKNRSKQNDKTTLFIFLTPYIIDNPQRLIDITEKYQHFQQENTPYDGQRVPAPQEEPAVPSTP